MFEARGITIIDALDKIKKVVGSTIEFIFLRYEEGWLYISADKDGRHTNKIQIRIPATGSQDILKFCVKTPVLEGLCTKRQEIIFEQTNETTVNFKVKTGKYHGHFACTPYQEIVVLDKNAKSKKLSQELQAELLKWLPKMKIEDLWTGETMVLLIKADKTGLHMACADNYHGVVYLNKQPDLGELELAVPVQYIDLIGNLLKEDKKIPQKTKVVNQIGTNTQSLFIWNEEMEVKLPLVATDKVMSHLFANARVNKAISTKFDSAQLSTVMSNLTAFYQEKASILCQLQDQGLQMTLHTSHGTASDTIQLLNPVQKTSFRLEPRIFNVLSKKMSGQVRLSLSGKKEWTSIVMSQALETGKFSSYCVTVEN
jgi:hypothetical protein